MGYFSWVVILLRLTCSHSRRRQCRGRVARRRTTTPARRPRWRPWQSRVLRAPPASQSSAATGRRWRSECSSSPESQASRLLIIASSNESVLSLLRRLSTWRYPHLLSAGSTVPQRACNKLGSLEISICVKPGYAVLEICEGTDRQTDTLMTAHYWRCPHTTRSRVHVTVKRLQASAYRYLLPACNSEANPPAAVAAVDRWDRRTVGHPTVTCGQRQ